MPLLPCWAKSGYWGADARRVLPGMLLWPVTASGLPAGTWHLAVWHPGPRGQGTEEDIVHLCTGGWGSPDWRERLPPYGGRAKIARRASRSSERFRGSDFGPANHNKSMSGEAECPVTSVPPTGNSRVQTRCETAVMMAIDATEIS